MKALSFRKMFCVIAVVLTVAFKSGAVELNVFAAASLTDALKEIAKTYEQHTAEKVSFYFGPSSTLARQIDDGAPADIFFSADEAKMDALELNGRILKDTRKSRLSNSLVIVVSADSTLAISSASNLTNAAVKRIALADPKAVPAGVYAKAYLEKLKLWPLVESKVVPTENVRGALAAVESGNIEAGIVYKTDAAISRKVKVACEVPRSDGPDISYPMALVSDSRQLEAARKFLQYLDSSDAGKVFEKFGFIVRK
jgi:molybdate transport system substrate-binding protein